MRIPLASAALCQDCQCISDNLVECECGSKAMMTLSAVLNRPQELDLEEVTPNEGELTYAPRNR